MVRAREHHKAGWKPGQIRNLLDEEFGVRPRHETVRAWVDDKYRKRLYETGAARWREKRQSRRNPVEQYYTDGWKLHRMRELRDAGLTYMAVAAVAKVWWGQDTDEEHVRYLLGGPT